MHGQTTLYVDQWGNHFWAKSVAELRDQIGGGKVSKMYNDGKYGKTYHTGYVVGQHWCSAFLPLRQEVPETAKAEFPLLL